MELFDLTTAAWILFGVSTAVFVVQVPSGIKLAAILFRFRRERCAEADLPPAAVIVAIRGPDPFLAEMLNALLTQDYPSFGVYIVLDDADDPAAEIVRSVIRQTNSTRVRISVLKNHPLNRSLKCSSLIQAIEDLESEYRVIAFIDGDAKPCRHWLRDLIAPLRDPKIGVVTGNRWYMPEGSQWGSLVRYFWNAGAFGQMWFHGMVWAGSMAMRRETIERISMLEHWSHVLSVDSTLYRVIRSSGLKVAFASSVIMVNSESTTLPQFRSWVRRQLVGAKSAKNGWPIVLLHAFALVGLQVLGTLCVGAAVAVGNNHAAVIACGALGLYWVSSLMLAFMLEAGVRRIAELNGQPRRWIGAAHAFRFFPAMVLTHFVYIIDLTAACFCKRVSWRGIDYELLDEDNSVRLVSYRPYRRPLDVRGVSSVV